MIKGVDAQVMTQRAAEYSKDVSAMLRRDELANEFADRMSKLNAQQEMKTVSHLEKAEHARVNADQEKESRRQKTEQQAKGNTPASEAGAPALEMELPSIGVSPSARLLDIEV